MKHTWYEPTDLSNYKRRKTDAKNKRRLRGSKHRRPVPPLATYNKLAKYGHPIRLAGYETKYYYLKDIANIFNIAPHTVARWHRLGMLPEPFFRATRRSWGKTRCMYLKEQVLAICRVLNDIYDQGYTQFRQDHVEHIKMMHEGARIMLESLNNKPVTTHESYTYC